MENLMPSTWFLAALAVSGSIAFIAVRAHKRVLADFVTEVDSSSKGGCSRRCEGSTRRVRFADDVVEPSSDGKDYQRRYRDAERKSDDRKGRRVPAHRMNISSA